MDESRPAGSVRSSGGRRIDADLPDLVRELLARLREDPTAGVSHDTERMLGTLWAELDLRANTSANRYSATKALYLLEIVRSHPDCDAARLTGATCLEFGCGGLNPGGGLFALLLAGALRGIGIDLDDIESPPAAARALYTLACAALTHTHGARFDVSSDELRRRIASFDLDKLARGDVSGVDLDRLRYVQKPIEEAGIPDGSIDIVYSNSVYEHLVDPAAITAELARVMKPGAIAVHAIDGVDHRWYSDPSSHPLGFLRDGGDAALVHGCNRIRPLAFAETFERHGLEVRGVLPGNVLALTGAEVASFAAPFRGMPPEHLATTRARFYLRKR